MTKISPQLRESLQFWLDTATSDSPPESVRENGLCFWIDVTAHECGNEFRELRYDEFGEDRMTFPFGYMAYFDDVKNGTCHLDPARLAWVRQLLQQP